MVYRSEEDVYRVEVTHEKPVKLVDKVLISVKFNECCFGKKHRSICNTQ